MQPPWLSLFGRILEPQVYSEAAVEAERTSDGGFLRVCFFGVSENIGFTHNTLSYILWAFLLLTHPVKSIKNLVKLSCLVYENDRNGF